MNSFVIRTPLLSIISICFALACSKLQVTSEEESHQPNWLKIYLQLNHTIITDVSYNEIPIEDIFSDFHNENILAIPITIEQPIGKRKISISHEKISALELIENICNISSSNLVIENSRILITSQAPEYLDIMSFKIPKELREAVNRILDKSVDSKSLMRAAWVKNNAILSVKVPASEANGVRSAFGLLGMEELLDNSPF